MLKPTMSLRGTIIATVYAFPEITESALRDRLLAFWSGTEIEAGIAAAVDEGKIRSTMVQGSAGPRAALVVTW